MKGNLIWWTSDFDLNVLDSQMESFGINTSAHRAPADWPPYLYRAAKRRFALRGSWTKGVIFLDKEFGEEKQVQLDTYNPSLGGPVVYSSVASAADGGYGNQQGLCGIVVKPEDLDLVRDLPGLLSTADLLDLRWIGPREIRGLMAICGK